MLPSSDLFTVDCFPLSFCQVSIYCSYYFPVSFVSLHCRLFYWVSFCIVSICQVSFCPMSSCQVPLWLMLFCSHHCLMSYVCSSTECHFAKCHFSCHSANHQSTECCGAILMVTKEKNAAKYFFNFSTES